MTGQARFTDATVPTLVEVWAPRCGQCRAMAPDITAVAAEFTGKVDFVEVDVSCDWATAAELGAVSTPTLVGFIGGEEVYRATGRATRPELRELFAALSAGQPPQRAVRRSDVALRTGAGATLLILGVAAGPSIPLLVVGSAVVSWGLMPLLRSARVSGP